ncbi:Alcohol dehydrogenase 3, mitochondrial [Cladophialophora carrionii]|uniref:Alcohol dehydrogenase 3, mitochondrial n=1 Tax=Cladophialophora carrionii TaxID=86049 RepID=A0A1C1C7G4_9EURO|nr:Alcohol dehydrogenase 3, mitochondrial [Cladophialophora carrionii]
MGSPQKTMLACQVVEFHKDYVIHQVPIPAELGPHDLLLKVAAASLCHTDSMVVEGRMAGVTLPVTASHEGAGKVVAKGDDVQGFDLGDRVLAGIPRNRCGQCQDCSSQDPQYCSSRDGGIGFQLDGAFAEYLVVDSRNACHIPDDLDHISAAPMACAGITAWRALIQANVGNGQWLGVVGSGGGLGHLALKFAKAQGIRVIGVDARDEGLDLTREAGAEVVVDARKGREAVVAEVHSVTAGQGVDATINFSEAVSAAGLACAITRKHGGMIQVAQAKVVIPFRELIFRDIKVSGSLTGSPKQTQEMLNFAARHGIGVQTQVYQGLERIPDLVKDAHSGKIKGKGIVVVDATIR